MAEVARWELFPKQEAFWKMTGERSRVAFVGGIRSGKTLTGTRRLVLEALKRGGLSWVIVPTYTMMGGSLKTFDEVARPWILSKRENPFPVYWLERDDGSKAEVEFRSAEDPDKLRGPSLQAILVDEGAQLKDDVILENGRVVRRCAAWEILLGRTLDTGGPIYVTTTPKGKNWLYEAFVERPGREYGVVFARTDENLKLSGQAIQELRKSYSGTNARQELDAEFVSGEGVFFGEWNPQIHLCEPSEGGSGWRWYGALDDGFSAPAAFGLYGQDSEGTIRLVKEVYAPGLVTEEKAKVIAQIIGQRRLSYIVCDPSMWAKRSDSGIGTAEVLTKALRKQLGVMSPPLVKGSNNRHEGWKRVREWLTPVMELGEDGEERWTSRLQISTACPHFLRTFPAMLQEPHDVEDVETHGEDHHGDQIRYLLMSRPQPKKVVPILEGTRGFRVAEIVKDVEKTWKRIYRGYTGEVR